MPAAVIVNGLPGSGKSTLARALYPLVDLPLLTKDVVKETLFDWLGVADRAWSQRLGAAGSEVIWSLLATCPRGAVVEGWFSTASRDLVAAGLARAGADPVLEVFCDVPFETARARFTERAPHRHPGHVEHVTVTEYHRWRGQDRPLAFGEVLRVASSGPVDVATVADWVRPRLPGAARPASLPVPAPPA